MKFTISANIMLKVLYMRFGVHEKFIGEEPGLKKLINQYDKTDRMGLLIHIRIRAVI